MVLVTVVPVMREDQVRAKRTRDLLERPLDLLPVIREVTASELFDDDSFSGRTGKKCVRARARFTRAAALRAEHHPPDRQALMIADQLEQRAAAANLDVVGMRAEAQDVLDVLEAEFDHDVSVSSLLRGRSELLTVRQAAALNPLRSPAILRRHRKRRS